jgi:hypothetical protein
MKRFYAEVEDHISTYENGTITISDDIEFSMRATVKQITHYILSRYVGSQTDEIGRRKPFRNTGNAIVDLEWRAKNIDRKSIEGHATDGDYIFSLVVNKELQQWMKDNNFGKTIDDYQRKKSEYGSVLLKKTETADELIIEPVNWEYTYVDPNDIANGMKLEKSELSFLALKKKADAWTEQHDGELAIDAAIAAAKKKKEKKVEIYDIEGEFEACIFDETEKDEDETIGLYNIILAVVGNKKFCLYKKKLKESRFKYDRRKAVEGRDMGLGVWEECFEPQIWTNEAVIGEKFAMDLGGKVVIKTNKKGLPSVASMVDGEIIDLAADEFFDPVSLMPSAMPEFQNQIDNWFINMQRDQSAFPGMTGEEPKAGAPAQSLMLQAAQGGSIFNKRRDQDGFFLLEVIIDWVLSFCIKQTDKDHTLGASYSAKELELLDEAIADFKATTQVKDSLLSDDILKPGMPFGTQPGEMDILKGTHREHLRKTGNQRTLKVPKGFITLAKIKQKMRFDITDEMLDDQRKLNALASTLAAMSPDDPQRTSIIQEMMEISGLSAATFPMSSAPVQATAAPRSKMSKVGEVLPQGQQV